MLRAEPAERLIFAHAVEGLLRHGLKGTFPPGLAPKLRALGLDIERKLLPAYPVAVWARCLNVVVAEVYPGLSREEGFRRLARATALGYGETLVGRAAFGFMRLRGPRRAVARLPQTLQGSDNYTNATVTERGPGHFELHLNTVMDMPGYTESLLETLLELVGVREPRVKQLAVDAQGTTYRLTWQEA